MRDYPLYRDLDLYTCNYVHFELAHFSVRCDVIILLSIYDVIQSPQIRGGILVHAQAVDTRPTSLSEVRPAIEASIANALKATYFLIVFSLSWRLNYDNAVITPAMVVT